MEQRGDWPARSPWIRQAVAALPRHDFAPPVLWRWNGQDAYEPIHRDTNPAAWAELVYGDPDTAAVTQLADDLPSSSLSATAVVAEMLDSLDLAPGHRVLELGTGTGWHAALTAHRAGPGRVVSIETDPQLADEATARLRAAGLDVAVRVGDGLTGAPDDGLFDRVIATFAVDPVPWAWIAQTRPGGVVVFPRERLGHFALTVDPDGQSASGRVRGLAQFMPTRDRLPTLRVLAYSAVRGDGDPDDERPFRPVDALEDISLQFALRALLPDVQIDTGRDEDGVSAWLHDGTSWASLSAQPDGPTIAYQGGPRRLADELERAWDWWATLGSPGIYEWGMTVTRDRQTVWCLNPGHPVDDRAPV